MEDGKPSKMQTFGAVLFLASIALVIYGYFATSAGAIVLAVVAFGASLGAFVSGLSNQRKAQLDRIERNQQS